MAEPTNAVAERRSDGERTHAAILEAAMRLASVEGLAGLTIGGLAEALGISKSGVYAHFGSKERLQLETIEAAREVFQREVIEPGLAAPEGLGQLEAIAEAYLSYVERAVFPGGCFFAQLLGEFDSLVGPLHEEVEADQQEWLGLVEHLAAVARDQGQLSRGAEPKQLSFEIVAALDLANYLYILTRDAATLERGRVAVRAAVLRQRRAGRRPGETRADNR